MKKCKRYDLDARFEFKEDIEVALFKKFKSCSDYFLNTDVSFEQFGGFNYGLIRDQLAKKELRPEIMKKSLLFYYNKLDDNTKKDIQRVAFEDFKVAFVDGISITIINDAFDDVFANHFNNGKDDTKTLFNTLNMKDLILGTLTREQIAEVINGVDPKQYLDEIARKSTLSETMLNSCIKVQQELATRDFTEHIKGNDFFLECFSIYNKNIRKSLKL